jgi:hypothetical protein
MIKSLIISTPDFPAKGTLSFTYTTEYKPDTTAIDLFYTADEAVT